MFYNATVGELADPGGTDERVEVLLWQLKQNSSTRGGHEIWSSGVALTFPRTLPLFGFYPKSDYWKATRWDFWSVPRIYFWTSPSRRRHLKQLFREYDALAALGPDHGSTRVLVTEDWVFSALVRPEVIQRPQLSGRHVRLDGNVAVAWAKGRTSPKMLEECAIELYELVNLLPRG
ncbi:hypothetical protein T261_3721 [Streptomyces lydicus]|nr:hypothetical protein T261_3721 [Streptomyces lydicus]